MKRGLTLHVHLTSKGFFTVRAVKLWNLLPQAAVISAESADKLKNVMDVFLSECNIQGYGDS